MGGRLLEGPTMVGRTSDWKEGLGRFLKPFLDRLGHKARRQMCPLYVSRLIDKALQGGSHRAVSLFSTWPWAAATARNGMAPLAACSWPHGAAAPPTSRRP